MASFQYFKIPIHKAFIYISSSAIGVVHFKISISLVHTREQLARLCYY